MQIMLTEIITFGDVGKCTIENTVCTFKLHKISKLLSYELKLLVHKLNKVHVQRKIYFWYTTLKKQ